MAIFKCKMCGGSLEISGANETVGTCEYCGTKQTLPKLDNEKREQLYDRANHFRRNNEYDKAANIYEQILNEDKEDAEAYWSLVLCRYGIEYVEDPVSHKRVPTVNRTQYTSIFEDEDYKSALKYADDYQKSIYESEAKAIDNIQKGILDISSKEEPFDIFICYKETDESGSRTPDSVYAFDIYNQLTEKGYRVFFSRVTLEEKIGSAYEPYIFAALNTAKIMLVVGTKQEFFNAVWVKNEWSRFLFLINQGQKKTLIPIYKDMDPYSLPVEFSYLQALDMSKLGFMQDLIRGVDKILIPDKKNSVKNETVVIQEKSNENINILIKRGYMLLEDGDWQKSDLIFEKVMNNDPENVDAYIGKWLAKIHKDKIDDIASFYIDKYNKPQYINLEACPEESEHIKQMSQKYKINNFWDENEIKKFYDHIRYFSSSLKSFEENKKLALAELNNESFYSRAKQFAGEEKKNKLKKINDEVENYFDELINKQKNEDNKNKNLITKAYSEHIVETDGMVQELYNKKVDFLENKYQNALKLYESAQKRIEDKTIRNNNFDNIKKDLDFANNSFKDLLDFKDSKLNSIKCENEAKRLKDLIKEDKKVADNLDDLLNIGLIVGILGFVLPLLNFLTGGFDLILFYKAKNFFSVNKFKVISNLILGILDIIIGILTVIIVIVVIVINHFVGFI